MSELKEKLSKWAEVGASSALYKWNEFYDIPLYMDQIITMLGDRLEPYRRDEGDKLLTSTMINNYVKGEVISHPIQKKYSREQVASILVVAMLKSVLSMQDLKILLSDCPDTADFYKSFEETQSAAMSDVCTELTLALENGENLKLFALKLAAEANARRAAAEQILLEIEKEIHPKPSKRSLTKS